MRKVPAIITNDLRVFLADRSNLPGLLLTPVVMTVIIALVNGGAFGGRMAPLRLDAVDRDRTPISEQFLAAVGSSDPSLTLCHVGSAPGAPCALEEGAALSEQMASERLARSVSVGYLELPSGFGEAVQSGEPISVRLHTSGEFGPAQAARQAVEAALTQINGAAAAARVGRTVMGELRGAAPTGSDNMEMSQALYRRALTAWRQSPLRIPLELSGGGEATSVTGSLQSGLRQSVPGMGTMFVMMTVLGAMAALIEERRDWTLQRLAVMPLSRAALVGAKILGRFTLGALQFVVIFAVGAALGMNFGRSPLALILIALAYTLSVTAISFALGSRLQNPAQASGMALLLTLTLSPLGGAWWPMELSPRFMQIAGHISPVAWAMDGFTALTYERATLGDVWIPILVLLGMSLLGFLIAIPRFEYQQ
jgi:ABC-2 type transport system permease protein